MTGERPSHRCLRRGCHHPDSEHLSTPELAGPQEVVVWCSACQRHETWSPRRWFFPRLPSSPSSLSDSFPRAFQ